MKIYSNIVSEEVTRRVQRKTLNILAQSLSRSFGPGGSTTCITKHMAKDGSTVSVTHSKDGYTIIKNIQFLHPIEQSVQDLVTDITHYIVREVGDGTTSAVILCNTLFETLCDNNIIDKASPGSILDMLGSLIDEICRRILEKGWEATIEDLYDICLIATNNNVEISKTIRNMYETYGMDVYIDVGTTKGTINLVKEYDGMTLETGFNNMCYAADKTNNSTTIKNPRIYCFSDPIDTPEMLNFLDVILESNILSHFRPGGDQKPVPTVILCKAITPDGSSFMENVVKMMNQYPGALPLLIVSDIHQDYLLEDIVTMCGGKFIKKYINPDIRQTDEEQGLAPTMDTITDFCGYAEAVRSDEYKTQVIKPSKMFNPDGSLSDEYNVMINYVKTQLDQAIARDMGTNEIATLRRRYNSLKGNMVDFLIGGITQSDRDALKAAVEDAVLSCRSAVTNGVGYGGSYMAYKAIQSMLEEEEYSNNKLLQAMKDAYVKLIVTLYKNSIDDKAIDAIFTGTRQCPLNIRTNEYDGKVKAAINGDVAILQAIKKILGMMYTDNQYILPSPQSNLYEGGMYSESATTT